MGRVMRRGVWIVAAMFCLAVVSALAQEGAPGKAGKGPGQAGQKFWDLNQKIRRMLEEAAQADAGLRAMQEAQQAKYRAVNERRNAIIAATPELKAIQDEIEASRKKEAELAREVVEKNPEIVQLQNQQRELNQKLEAKRREVANASPELSELRKKNMELYGKIFAALRDNEELRKLNAESEAAWNEMTKKAAQSNPELAKLLEERDALWRAAAPAPEKPAAPTQKKE